MQSVVVEQYVTHLFFAEFIVKFLGSICALCSCMNFFLMILDGYSSLAGLRRIGLLSVINSVCDSHCG